MRTIQAAVLPVTTYKGKRMALSGIIYGTTDNKYIQPRLIFSVTQSLTGNYSDITAILCYSRTNTGYTTEGTWEGSITVAGQNFPGSGRLVITYESGTEAMRCTARVYHGADGTASVTLSAAGAISGTTLGSTSLSQTVTLDPIPRYSEITASDTDIGAVCTIKIIKQAQQYRHSIRYSLTGTAPWTYIDENGKTGTMEKVFQRDTVLFTVPDHFYSQIPTAKTGICTLECWTYVTETDYLPEAQRTTFTYRADPNQCGPAVSCRVTDTNSATLALTGSAATLVRYMSDALVEVEATGSCAASVPDTAENIAVWHGGEWRYGAPVAYSGVQSDYFRMWARDSRGYTVYTDHYVKNYVNYIRLTNQTVPVRNAPTGSTVELQITGSCYNGTFGGSKNIYNTVAVWYRLASSSAELSNMAWCQVEPVLSGSTYGATVVLEGLAYDREYWAETWVEDRLAQAVQRVKISRGVPVFDWGREDFCFHVPVELPSLKVDGAQVDLVIASGTWGGWEYRKWSSGTAECWKSKTAAVTCDQPWESLYYGTVSQEQFPAGLFVQTPVLTVTLEHRNVFFSKAAATKDGTGELFALSAARITEAEPCTLQYTARGKWK